MFGDVWKGDDNANTTLHEWSPRRPGLSRISKYAVFPNPFFTCFFKAESDTCEMSACEVFVDYGDEPDTDFDSICPEIKQDYTYKSEYIVEFIEGNILDAHKLNMSIYIRQYRTRII